MAAPRVPVLQPIDQSTDAALVMNAVYGQTLSLYVNGALLTSARVDALYLNWLWAGNTKGFGQVADGRPFWTGDFNGDGKADILFYYPGDFNWWLGTFDAGGSLTWGSGPAGNTRGFGQVWDKRPFWTGRFSDSRRRQILFYYPGDFNWWLGSVDASGNLSWGTGPAGDTKGFGQVADGRPFWIGDFDGDGRDNILFYYPGDFNWWLGTFDTGGKLTWGTGPIGNTKGFGQVWDKRPFWTGRFSDPHRTQILFYYPGDDNWWLGTINGAGKLDWGPAAAGNSKGFGQVADGRPFWSGDFNGDGRDEMLFYYPGDFNWWLGTFDTVGRLTWGTSRVGNTKGFGQIWDKRPFWIADFNGDGKADVLFYYPGDRNWWLGTLDPGGQLAWGRRAPGNTRGFGQVADGRPFWTEDFNGDGKADILFYYPGDFNWWLGAFDGARVSLPHHLSSGDTVTASPGPGAVNAMSQPVTVQHNYVTQHYDNDRTGWNPAEKTLSVDAVRRGFGLLYRLPVDEKVYAQPLYVEHVPIPGHGVRSVVYVATEADSLYAFDAASSGPPLWHRQLVPSGERPVDWTELDRCGNIYPRVGITGTPVIDVTTNTLFAVTKTSDGRGHFHQRLHAIDLSTGADRVDSPADLGGSVKGISFDPQWQLQRPGLLLCNGVIYIGFGSHCDKGTYCGWVFAYDSSNLDQIGIFNAAPNKHFAGVWQSGIGLAGDEEGYVYFLTGNGELTAHTGGADYGDSVVKLSPDLSHVVDYFTPSNHDAVRSIDTDIDLGSGGPMLLSPQKTGMQGILVACGKEGTAYLLDRGRLGRYRQGPGGDDLIISKLTLPSDSTISDLRDRVHRQPGIFGGWVYYQGSTQRLVYCCGNQGLVTAYGLLNGQLSRESMSAERYGSSGSTPTVSSNDSHDGSAVVWVLQRSSPGAPQPLVLRAYNALNLGEKLYEEAVGPWTFASPSDLPGLQFLYPTVIDGRVYVGGDKYVAVFGIR